MNRSRKLLFGGENSGAELTKHAAPSLGLVAGLLLATAATSETVTCESRDRMEQFCRTDTSGGVLLETQLSRAPCQRGSTWGYDRRGIWVANGCRAVFETGRTSHDDSDDSDAAAAAVAGLALLALGAAAAHSAHDSHHSENDEYYRYDHGEDDISHHTARYSRNKVVACDSTDNKYHYCKFPLRGARVSLLHRNSKSSCRFHEDWGYNAGGIWVENGCRATFEIAY